MKRSLCKVVPMFFAISILTSSTVFAKTTTVTTITTTTDDDAPISIKVDGYSIYFDQEPIIEKGVTLVPFRAILESMGVAVEWNDKTKVISCRKGTTVVTLKIGSKTMTVNNKAVTLDVAPKIVNGRTLIPVRAVSQAFGAKVEWNSSIRLIEISTYQPTHEDITSAKATNVGTTDELHTLMNKLTQQRSKLSNAGAEELVTLITQINAYERTVKNYGNITDTDKLSEIQSQYSVYIQKLKNFAKKYNLDF